MEVNGSAGLLKRGYTHRYLFLALILLWNGLGVVRPSLV